MSNPFRLYLVTDRELIGEKGVEEVIGAAIRGGVSAIQIREKNINSRDFVELGRKIKTILKNTDIPLIVNDRLDIAQVIDADGVHVGQSDIDHTDARRIFGKNKIVGVTLEFPEEIEKTDSSLIDYIGVSSIYPSQTKTDVQNFWTKENIQLLKSKTHVPLIGIGGINLKNAYETLGLGLDGIAVVSAICYQPTLAEVESATRQLRSIIEERP